MQNRIGGSFAPPITSTDLDAYRELASDERVPPQIAEVMTKLCKMVEVYHEVPKGKKKGTPHPSGRGTVVGLDASEIARIDHVVPWKEELEVYARLFDAIPADTHKELRDAAHHLLWYGWELFLDREPITTDLL